MNDKSAKRQNLNGYFEKNSYLIVASVMVLCILAIWVLFSGIPSMFSNTIRLVTPAGTISVEVADTSDSRTKGLSGHEQLTDNSGMLFVFDSASTDNCFWMKDMKFSIDMVWLDADKHVMTVATNVAPETYPSTFCPDSPAKYGLELGSGRAQVLEIIPGARLRW